MMNLNLKRTMKRYIFSVFALALFFILLMNKNMQAQGIKDYIHAGDTKAEQNDFEGAILEYDQAVSLFQMELDSTKKTGLNASHLEDYLEVSQVFFKRGLAKSKIKEYKSAIEDYSMAITLKPTHANAFYNRAQAEFYIREYEKSLQDFNTYMGFHSNSASAYFGRAMVKIRMGDSPGGCADFKLAEEKGYVISEDLHKKYCP